MIVRTEKTHALSIINLGWSTLRCCQSDFWRMQNAFDANHSEEQSVLGPDGQGEHHEQTSH